MATIYLVLVLDRFLRLVPGLVDGVVVALVGDVVLVSRPCWLHITREGLLNWAATLVLRQTGWFK